MASAPAGDPLTRLWAGHTAEWREPAQIVSQWRDASMVPPSLLSFTVSGGFWEVIADLDLTVLVTREYEHLVVALAVTAAGPSMSFMAMPHPSGLVADRARRVVHIASTRQPNHVYTLGPVRDEDGSATLIPLTSRFLPGSLYLHDLSLIGGELHGNAVGWDAVVRLDEDGSHPPVWWPSSVEGTDGAAPHRNHLQLNSIAAGATLATSFFSASAERPGHRRPGHRNFPVDGRGVIFAGATREPCVRGLTRPHSARIDAGELWVGNSGYGEVGIAEDGRQRPVVRLPGWTRGLHLEPHHIFAGTSRVIPAYRQYAPGVDLASSVCGLHIINRATGGVLGSLVWPDGNQIFAIDCIPSQLATRLPFTVRRGRVRMHDPELFNDFIADPDCYRSS